MLWRDNIYTVHVKEDLADPAARTQLVREGFSFWAFAFTILWLLANRLWLMSAIYLALMLLLVRGGAAIGLPEASCAILQFGLQLWLGLAAHDLQRAALARRGYDTRGIVVGESELLATQRYYDRVPA
jgi:hypothetical protein